MKEPDQEGGARATNYVMKLFDSLIDFFIDEVPIF